MANALQSFDPLIFSKKLVEKLDQINIMLAFANRDYDGDLTENSTVRIRTVGNVTVGPYTGTINYQDLSPSHEDFTVSDTAYFAFKTSDIENRQTDIDTMDVYAARAAVALSDTIEAKIMAQYAKAHADNKITGDGNAAIALTVDNLHDYFLEAGERLRVKNVPSSGRWAVVDPKTATLVEKWLGGRATALGDQAIAGLPTSGDVRVDNYVGNVAGFKVFWSNATPRVTGAGAAKYLLFGEGQPINYAGQLSKTRIKELENSFDVAMSGLLLHDATIVSENKKRVATLKAAP